MSNETELKPCLRCDSKDVGGVGGKASASDPAYSYIHCYGCNLEIRYGGELNEAIKYWNYRPLEAKQAATIKTLTEALKAIGEAGTWHEVCKAWDSKGKPALTLIEQEKEG